MWFGNDDYAPTNRMTGGSLPGMTWRQIMAYAHQGIEIKPMPGVAPGPTGAAPQVAAAPQPAAHPAQPRPTMLTKRSIDVLLRVERMMEDATAHADQRRGAAARRRRSPGPTRSRRLTTALRAAIDAGAIGTIVRLLLGFLFAFAVAAVFGLGLTQFALTRGTAFGAITIGAWTAWPKTGTAEIDPYARAAIARSGELPIGSGDGVAFFASADDSRARARRALRRHDLGHHAGGALLDR